jgi:hypothetical protein
MKAELTGEDAKETVFKKVKFFILSVFNRSGDKAWA